MPSPYLFTFLMCFFLFSCFYTFFGVNPLTTDDKCTCHATLAASYQLAQSVLKIGFALASKKGGIGGGGRVSARSAVHMAAALAGCRKALVGTGLAISLLFDTNGHR